MERIFVSPVSAIFFIVVMIFVIFMLVKNGKSFGDVFFIIIGLTLVAVIISILFHSLDVIVFVVVGFSVFCYES